jgi:AraC-like DNA-binding protein
LLDFSGNYYICCNVFFNYEEEFDASVEDMHTSFAAYTISKGIATMLAESFNIYTVDFNNHLFAYIINLESETDKVKLGDVMKNLREYIDSIEDSHEITVGIGRMRNGINNLWKSNSDAMTAIEKRKPNHGFQVIDSDDLLICYTVNYSFDDENKIINSMKARDIRSLQNILRDIIQKNSDNILSHKHMNILFSLLYNTGIRYAAGTGFDIKKVASEEEQCLFNTDNSNISSFDHKLIRLTVFLGRVMEIATDDNRGSVSTLVTNIIDYIDSNYFNDIYIEKIASHMGLSTKYISRAFKLKTGLNMADYISLVRVKKSKLLLLNTNLSIDEICMKVGIFSRVTFYRSFKKFEGISPSCYRKVGDNNLLV